MGISALTAIICAICMVGCIVSDNVVGAVVCAFMTFLNVMVVAFC